MAKTENVDEKLQADVLFGLAQVYFFYGTYEGAVKLLSNIMMDLPLYDKMGRNYDVKRRMFMASRIV